jgi:hypothetical protein
MEIDQNGGWMAWTIYALAVIACLIAAYSAGQTKEANFAREAFQDSAIANQTMIVPVDVSGFARSDSVLALNSRVGALEDRPGVVSSNVVGEKWATCYGIAPANGSFRLDCEKKV